MNNRLAIRHRFRGDERRIRLHRRHGRQLPADPRRPAHRRPRGVARDRQDERVPRDRHEATVLGGILRQGHHAGQRFTISDSMEDISWNSYGQFRFTTYGEASAFTLRVLRLIVQKRGMDGGSNFVDSLVYLEGAGNGLRPTFKASCTLQRHGGDWCHLVHPLAFTL